MAKKSARGTRTAKGKRRRSTGPPRAPKTAFKQGFGLDAATARRHQIVKVMDLKRHAAAFDQAFQRLKAAATGPEPPRSEELVSGLEELERFGAGLKSFCLVAKIICLKKLG